jgi:hypothetical protein
VAVTSWGSSPWCTGVDFSYRTDTEAAIAWILETIPESEVEKIQFVELETQSGAAAAPSADKNDKDTGKIKHKKHGKAKGEKRKGGKGKGHHRR